MSNSSTTCYKQPPLSNVDDQEHAANPKKNTLKSPSAVSLGSGTLTLTVISVTVNRLHRTQHLYHKYLQHVSATL